MAQRSLLPGDGAVVLDCGAELYAWVGRHCPEDVRAAAATVVAAAAAQPGMLLAQLERQDTEHAIFRVRAGGGARAMRACIGGLTGSILGQVPQVGRRH